MVAATARPATSRSATPASSSGRRSRGRVLAPRAPVARHARDALEQLRRRTTQRCAGHGVRGSQPRREVEVGGHRRSSSISVCWSSRRARQSGFARRRCQIERLRRSARGQTLPVDEQQQLAVDRVQPREGARRARGRARPPACRRGRLLLEPILQPCAAIVAAPERADHVARDGEQPGELVLRQLVEPAPRDQEHLGGDLVGACSDAAGGVRVHRGVVRRQSRSKRTRSPSRVGAARAREGGDRDLVHAGHVAGSARGVTRQGMRAARRSMTAHT